MTTLSGSGEFGLCLDEGPRQVLLVGSSGGHLAQLLAMRPWWERRERTWITFDTVDARSQLEGEVVIWAHHPTTRNVPNALRNAMLAWSVLSRVQPELVVSTGAGVAFPFFAVARARGVRTVYVEVCDRIDTRTLTGRLCRPLSDLFMVQLEEQQQFYPDSVVIGQLL